MVLPNRGFLLLNNIKQSFFLNYLKNNNKLKSVYHNNIIIIL